MGLRHVGYDIIADKIVIMTLDIFKDHKRMTEGIANYVLGCLWG